MAALVESMVYVCNEQNGRFVPWHGLGVRVEEAPDSKQALIVAGLDWEVVKKDIIVPGCSSITDYKATVRTSDNTVLGVVTDRYKIVQNEEAFSFVDNIVDGENTRYETAGSLRNGKTVWMLAKLPTTKILDDEIGQYICFTNTHDGTGSVKVFVTPIRVVCNNTLTMALGSAKRSWYATHSGNIEGKMHEAEQTLMMTEKYMGALKKEAEDLVSRKFSDMQIAHMINELFPEPTADMSNRQKENIIVAKQKFIQCYNMDDLANFRGTGWAFVNAASDYMTHQSMIERNPYTEARFNKVLNGGGLLDKAHKLVLAA